MTPIRTVLKSPVGPEVAFTNVTQIWGLGYQGVLKITVVVSDLSRLITGVISPKAQTINPEPKNVNLNPKP